MEERRGSQQGGFQHPTTVEVYSRYADGRRLRSEASSKQNGDMPFVLHAEKQQKECLFLFSSVFKIVLK